MSPAPAAGAGATADADAGVGVGVGAGGPPSRGALRALVDRLGPGEISARLLDAVRALPGYREHLTGGVDVEAAMRWNVDLFLGVLLDGRRPTEADLDVLRGIVRARAADGMAPSVLLVPYRTGVRAAWRLLVEEADPAEQAALLQVAELLLEHADLLSATILDAFADEREALAGEGERRAGKLLEALVAPGPLRAEDRHLAERLGVPVRDAYRPFVLAVPGRPARAHAEAATRLRAGGALAATEGARVVGLAVDALPATAVGAAAGAGAVVAQGELVGRADLAGALDDLRALEQIAVARGRRGVVLVDEHLPELMLERSPALRERVVARVLGPLAVQPELERTLRALVGHDFDRAATAAALHVHRNTLGGRVARIEELCDGLRLETTEGRALAWLAVLRP